MVEWPKDRIVELVKSMPNLTSIKIGYLNKAKGFNLAIVKASIAQALQERIDNPAFQVRISKQTSFKLEMIGFQDENRINKVVDDVIIISKDNTKKVVIKVKFVNPMNVLKLR